MKMANDPVRLRALARRGSVLERGLEAARASGPSGEQLEALEHSLLTGVGIAAAAGAAAAVGKPQAAASAASWLTAGTAKLVVAVATVAAVGAGAGVAHYARSQRQQRPPSAVAPARAAAAAQPAPSLAPQAPAPEAARPVPMAETVGPLPLDSPAAKRRASKSGPRPPAQPAAAAADEEMVLLRRANEALAGAPAQALALTDEHLRRFPAGVLDEERELIAIQALSALGRGLEARQRGERFARIHAGSVYQKQIEAALVRQP